MNTFFKSILVFVGDLSVTLMSICQVVEIIEKCVNKWKLIFDAAKLTQANSKVQNNFSELKEAFQILLLTYNSPCVSSNLV